MAREKEYREKDRDRDRDRRDRDRDRDRDRRRDRDDERRDRDRDRDRERDRDKDKERESRKRDRERTDDERSKKREKTEKEKTDKAEKTQEEDAIAKRKARLLAWKKAQGLLVDENEASTASPASPAPTTKAPTDSTLSVSSPAVSTASPTPTSTTTTTPTSVTPTAAKAASDAVPTAFVFVSDSSKTTTTATTQPSLVAPSLQPTAAVVNQPPISVPTPPLTTLPPGLIPVMTPPTTVSNASLASTSAAATAEEASATLRGRRIQKDYFDEEEEQDPEQQTGSEAAAAETVEEEEDPLDAYMSGIYEEVKRIPNFVPVEADTSKIITLDDILGSSKQQTATVNGGTKQSLSTEKVEAGETAAKTQTTTPTTATSTSISGDSPNGDGRVNGSKPTATQKMDIDEEDDEEDEDDAEYRKMFLEALKAQSIKEDTFDEESIAENVEKKEQRMQTFSDDEDDLSFLMEDDDDDPDKKKANKKDLKPVDHSKIRYAPFRKDFYTPVKDIAKLNAEEVEALRSELDGITIRGKGCPAPIRHWHQCGLSDTILDILKENGFTKPFPIQAQAIPAIMSGRDVIACAKTGSGKTLGFVLPMLRHILDQPPLREGDGPIALIIAPTRELATQIFADVRQFTKALGLRAVCAYGGASIAEQIADFKRTAHIAVCTPGRMIDILCANRGRVTNLQRVTYVVLDEADRMFDMGFGPQVTRIVGNVRPDRQTVMFSATFPRTVEALARKILTKPIQMVVGGRSVVSDNIEQFVEIVSEENKFLRLLELLGVYYEKGNIIVFVSQQNSADNLFKDILTAGYSCLSLHGGMDQLDRDYTISQFKSKEKTLMVSTSVAARGLDVPDMVLVVNYDVPNHYEDYVHRVGRTGRAGRSGTAYTFITPEEEKHAPDLIRALKLANKPVPPELEKLGENYNEKCRLGLVEGKSHSGFGGRGFQFNEAEEDKKKEERKRQAKSLGLDDVVESESEDEVDFGDDGPSTSAAGSAKADKKAAAGAAAGAAMPARESFSSVHEKNMNPKPRLVSAPIPVGGPKLVLDPQANPLLNVAKAQAFAAALSISSTLNLGAPKHYELEIEINDYPQVARWKVTHKDALADLAECTGAAITTKGLYYAPNEKLPPGQRKLYLLIEGSSEESVLRAHKEVMKIINDAASSAQQGGRYKVL